MKIEIVKLETDYKHLEPIWALKKDKEITLLSDSKEYLEIILEMLIDKTKDSE